MLFEGLLNKQKRSLVAVGDKGGNFVILDRGNGEVLHRTVVDKQEGLGMALNTWSGGYYQNDKPPDGGFLVALKDTKGNGRADVMARFEGGARLPESWWRHTMEWRCI